MTLDFLLICAACPVVAGAVITLLRYKTASRIKNRIMRDLVGLETIWEDAGRNVSRA